MATPASAVRAVTQPNNTILKKSLQIIAVVLLVAVVLVAGYIFVTKVFKNHKNKPAINKPQTEIVNCIKRVS
jgi:flagellar basal body-associated protein FliL